MTATVFDERLARVEAGETLTPDEIRELSASPDIVSLGMLADTMRRRLRGTRTTYLRVSSCALDASFAEVVTPLAGEICITGVPETAAVAASAVRSARAVAGNRTVCGFQWSDIERLADAAADRAALLVELRREGLDTIAELPMDATSDITKAVEQLCAAGFEQIRLTVESGGGASRPELWLRAAALQQAFGRIQVLNPLPTALRSFRPTTGYEDVRSVAIARLAAPNVPVIQVDWTRYGPKLAQVALTFGADDLWGISSSDEAPEGRRRGPREEIRRNIEAAGFEAVERDGRFTANA
jgi:aminodeoxyfutalosine synthase